MISMTAPLVMVSACTTSRALTCSGMAMGSTLMMLNVWFMTASAPGLENFKPAVDVGSGHPVLAVGFPATVLAAFDEEIGHDVQWALDQPLLGAAELVT